MSRKRLITRATPPTTPAKRPAIPSGTAKPMSAPRPKPRPAHATMVATIRLPAATGELICGIEIGHGGRGPGGVGDVIDENTRTWCGRDSTDKVADAGTL